MSISTHIRSVRALPRPAWSPEILCRRCLQRWDMEVSMPSGVPSRHPVVMVKSWLSIETTIWGSQIGGANPCDLALRKRPGTRLIR